MNARIAASIVLALFLLISISYPNGLSLNSVGPKSLGMGGAFVGLANDYTAIFWNPAGLTQLQKNTFGVFATDIIPMGTYKLPAAKVDTKTMTNHYIAPNIMATQRFGFSDKAVFGLGIYVPAGLGAEWSGDDLKNAAGGKVYLWKTKIGIIDISPVVGYQISNEVSVGLALNIFHSSFDLDRPGGGGINYSETSTGWGYAVTFSGLVKPTEQFSIGATLRTRTWVKMDGSATDPLAQVLNPSAPVGSDFTRTMGWPMWIAGGIAYHPLNNLVLTADVQYSQWSSTENSFTAAYTDPQFNGVMKATNLNVLTMHWNDVTQIRVGGNYTVNENLDIRAGYYHDPAPAPDATLNVLFPSISYNAITFGAGYKMDNFQFDLAGEYLIGSDREIPLTAVSPAMPGTHGMNVPAFSVGVGYGF